MMLIYDRSYDLILTGIRIVPVFQAVQILVSITKCLLYPDQTRPSLFHMEHFLICFQITR